MPRAYSLDLRERLLRALASGLSAAKIESHTGVDATTLRRWRQRQARGDALAPPQHAPSRRPLIGLEQCDALRSQGAGRPNVTLAGQGAQWAAEQGQAVSVPAMCRLFRRIGSPLRKAGERQRAGRGHPHGVAALDDRGPFPDHGVSR